MPIGRPDTIGVVGGMGPLATADFLAKIVRATPVAAEHDHLAVIVANLPQVPDRQAAARGEGPRRLHLPCARCAACWRGLVRAVWRCPATPRTSGTTS